MEAPTPLVRLLRSVKGVDQVITRGEPLPHFDLHCPMLSLPAVIGTTGETIPWKCLICGPTPRRPVVANTARWSGLAWTTGRAGMGGRCL